MKVEYRRDLQNSYLVLITENQNAEDAYDLRMITENQIEGLLSCERKRLNNDILYYYDVTSEISLEDRCKVNKIHGSEILLLLNKLLGVLDKLDEYLLSEKSICLLPQYIYMDDKREQINFCYVPGECWDFQTQLRELMEYLLPYLEHANQDSMMMGYGMYHYILRERFTLEGLHEQLNLYHRVNKESTSIVEVEEKKAEENRIIDQKVEKTLQEIWKEDESIEVNFRDNEKNVYWMSQFSAVIGLLWALGGWFLWRNFRMFLWMWGIIGIGLVFIVIWMHLKGDKEKTENKKVIEYKQEENEGCTQVLFVPQTNKIYVLKNESNVISLTDKKNYIIGRDAKVSDIVLSSTVVSRKHCQIRLDENRCFLTDLYSKNGTRVNGVELVKGEEIELHGGELIQFADVNYYFQQEN